MSAWQQRCERFFHATLSLKGILFKFAIYFVSMIYSIAGPRQKKWCGNLWFIYESCRHSDDYQLAMTDACWNHPYIRLMSPQTALEAMKSYSTRCGCYRWMLRCVMESSFKRWSSCKSYLHSACLDATPTFSSRWILCCNFFILFVDAAWCHNEKVPVLWKIDKNHWKKVHRLVTDGFDESNFSLGLPLAWERRRAVNEQKRAGIGVEIKY